ncbi:Uncharacterized protein HZ326_22898 [Fusarium oxysporum f. sp. albedinis]|nr:Uncharacterized protein HZ326_22898 [Fusarium oxysporum f. sp. albedinis]
MVASAIELGRKLSKGTEHVQAEERTLVTLEAQQSRRGRGQPNTRSTVQRVLVDGSTSNEMPVSSEKATRLCLPCVAIWPPINHGGCSVA